VRALFFLSLATLLAPTLAQAAAPAAEGRLLVGFERGVDKPGALKDKVVSDGRLNASKALGAIGSIVD